MSISTNKIVLIFISCLFINRLTAQGVPRKAAAQYQLSLEKLRSQDLDAALPLLQKALELAPTFKEALLSTAAVYSQQRAYEKSVIFFERAQSVDSIYFLPYELAYAISLGGAGQFEKALQAINIFLTQNKTGNKKNAQYRKRCYEFGINYQRTHPATTNYVFRPRNLGDSVNSRFSEYYPFITADNGLLVFTRRGERISEYLVNSSIKNDTNFSTAKLIPGSLNNYLSKGSVTISSDGKWLIFAGNLPNLTFGNSFDLFISYSTPDGWSEPENLGSNINTEYWESAPSLSPDNQELYFCSDRSGGMGGSDLYKSVRDCNGHWQPAINLGKPINTRGEESTPYLHSDNQTMYFTSDSLPGYGQTDIFIVRKDSANNWGPPENLGYPINTIDNEATLAVSPNGATAYYASDRADSRGGLDLYNFDLRQDIRPKKTFYIKGVVYDSLTHKGLPSSIQLIINNTRVALMNVETDEQGNYLVPLPSGKDYTFTVNRKGYFYYSQLYELQNRPPDSVYAQNIALSPLRIGKTEIMHHIFFATNSYTLQPISLIELEKLFQLMIENPTVSIEVTGHTDNIGMLSNNQILSLNRAKAVVDFLIQKGIPSNRLSYKGLADEQPIADNATEEGRARNRRIELKIVKI